ncbi:dihydrofolate reductase family protein [Streptomyces sp. NPDC048504]|uniref:dihydrofolate reductase family protein n=1 Tax=Streptomyces sp. NPDC048504 TaxID=3365559 RepID=UPI003710FBF6
MKSEDRELNAVIRHDASLLTGRGTPPTDQCAVHGTADRAEFAHYKTLPKYVVSTTLTDDKLVSNWGETTILRDLDEVAALKETEGGPIIVHGSAALNHGLADAGLVDRYHLLVFPLLLGAGKRLFPATDKDTQKLKLVEHAVYANGLQLNVLDVVH